MPASWAKAFSPTIALFRCTTSPVSVLTIRLAGYRRGGSLRGAVFLWVGGGGGVPEGAGQVDRRPPRLDGRLHDFFQELQLRPARVLRRELHVRRVAQG